MEPPHGESFTLLQASDACVQRWLSSHKVGDRVQGITKCLAEEVFAPVVPQSVGSHLAEADAFAETVVGAMFLDGGSSTASGEDEEDHDDDSEEEARAPVDGSWWVDEEDESSPRGTNRRQSPSRGGRKNNSLRAHAREELNRFFRFHRAAGGRGFTGFGSTMQRAPVVDAEGFALQVNQIYALGGVVFPANGDVYGIYSIAQKVTAENGRSTHAAVWRLPVSRGSAWSTSLASL